MLTSRRGGDKFREAHFVVVTISRVLAAVCAAAALNAEAEDNIVSDSEGEEEDERADEDVASAMAACLND